MKTIVTVLLATVLGVGIVPRLALADGCASTCGAAKRTCQQASIAAFRSCHADVKATGTTGLDRKSALQSCRQAFAQAKQTCRSGLLDCVHACQTPPGSCQATCVQSGSTCLQGVVSTGRTCAAACPHDATRLSCLAACGAQAKAGLEQCKSTLQTCLGGCPSSPSGAFLD